jgi:ketosteroid isomerase-like protein
MSAENVDLVYQAVDAFNLGFLYAFLALCDRNVEFISRLVPLERGKPRRGHEGVRSWWEALHAAFQELSAEIDEVRDVGEVTVVRVRLSGWSRKSGAPMQQTQWHVARWRDKRAIRWRVFLSESEALAAAGLTE